MNSNIDRLMLLGRYLDPDVYQRTLNATRLFEATNKLSRKNSNAVSAGRWMNKLTDLNASFEANQKKMLKRIEIIDTAPTPAPAPERGSRYLYNLFKKNTSRALEDWQTESNIPILERYKSADQEKRSQIIDGLSDDIPAEKALKTHLRLRTDWGCYNNGCEWNGSRCKVDEGGGESSNPGDRCVCNLFSTRCVDTKAAYRNFGGADAMYMEDAEYARLKVKNKMLKAQIAEATKMLKLFHSK